MPKRAAWRTKVARGTWKGKVQRAFVVTSNEMGLVTIRSKCHAMEGFVAFTRIGPGKATVLFSRKADAQSAVAALLAAITVIQGEYCTDSKMAMMQAKSSLARVDHIESKVAADERAQTERAVALKDEISVLQSEVVDLQHAISGMREEGSSLRGRIQDLGSAMKARIDGLEVKLAETQEELAEAKSQLDDDLDYARKALVTIECDWRRDDGVRMRTRVCGSLVFLPMPPDEREQIALVVSWRGLGLERAGVCQKYRVFPHVEGLPAFDLVGSVLRGPGDGDVAILPLRMGVEAAEAWESRAARLSSAPLALLTTVTGVCAVGRRMEAIRCSIIGSTGRPDVYVVDGATTLRDGTLPIAGWGLFCRRELVAVASAMEDRHGSQELWLRTEESLRKALGSPALRDRAKHCGSVAHGLEDASRRDARAAQRTLVMGVPAIRRVLQAPKSFPLMGTPTTWGRTISETGRPSALASTPAKEQPAVRPSVRPAAGSGVRRPGSSRR